MSPSTSELNPMSVIWRSLTDSSSWDTKSFTKQSSITLTALFSINGSALRQQSSQNQAYSRLLYNFNPTLGCVCCVQNYTPNDRGFSYLEEKKLAGKTRFLKEFYKGKGPHYQNP
eukprot:TRINITY_DN1139_c0_g1_i3.p2 TRINITY_DN1139_c0_g1~~TRINITY_DN1139_c0_g1_i3.p2  ORF type:complete len:115 (+),score=0.20 TRINITY_DN1139_c0_g1_i3:445-789(+)